MSVDVPEDAIQLIQAVVIQHQLALASGSVLNLDSGRDLQVRLPVFEGPLDLLLYLIRKDELDIYDIPIEQVTAQYIEYLDLMQMLCRDICADTTKPRTFAPE